MTADIRIREVQEADWDAIVALEARAYADHGLSEGREALRSRHAASPGTCYVLEHAGRVGGYLLALPYPLFRSPDLGLGERRGGARPGAGTGAGPGAGPSAGTGAGPGAGPSNLHAHDLVIAEDLRGRGLAPRLMRHLHDTARTAGYRTVSLVAVLGAQAVWAPLGYRARPEIGLPESYGPGAVYMAMPLRPAAVPTLATAATELG